MTAPVFGLELQDGSSAPPPAVLGPWRVRREPAAGASFSPTAGDAVTLRWRARLPADPIAAGTVLGEAEARLAATREALPAAEARLRALGVRGPSFGSTGPTAGRPESDLLAALGELQGRGPSPSGPVSYGPVDAARGAWDRAAGAFENAVGRLRRHLGLEATVETDVGGRVLARTLLGRTGGTTTVWSAGLAAADADLHRRNVKLALASREALLRSVVLAMRGAALLAVAGAGPGGALLALPAAWKFIDDVVAEVEATRSLWREAIGGR